MTRLTRRFLVSLTIVVALGPVQPSALQQGAPASGALTDLHSVDELKDLFNRDAGKVRLVLLISPT